MSRATRSPSVAATKAAGWASLSSAHPTASRDGSGEARDVDWLLGDEFEEGGLAFAGLRDAALDRTDDLARLGHALAVAAERLGEIGVIAADVGRTIFLGRHRHHLQFDRHREIVRQDRQDRQALAHRGLEI